MNPCRFCSTPLDTVFADLGVVPLANAYVHPDRLLEPELFYPLVAYVCDRCLLVQVPPATTPEQLFSDYAYFSSYSDSWLTHARRYFEMIRERLSLGGDARIVEIASNDGYLLQYFRDAGFSVLGIEPAANVGAVAREKGIETRTKFFGVATAGEIEGRADLLIANNVLAHVPDINDFVEGLRIALAPAGTLTIEFPHLLQIMRYSQFDTIYHEHYSYLSLLAVQQILAAHGLTVVDVEEIPTHGGSLRVYARHTSAAGDPRAAVRAILDAERAEGLDELDSYRRFADGVRDCKRALLQFLIAARDEGKRVVGYGAPAKASTLLNYCGARTDFIDYTVDRSAYKQGLLVPGTRIPIHAPEKIAETRPDYVLLLAWNLRDEIISQMSHIREWGGRFVIPIPKAEVV
ncbi:MAG TPA: class I SAM-dependent methyltransferase [Thermoanaerobaculia bacterium]|jgi:SAM-dependent methyltransferase|nr:class I SAM-dependent methyltransferase [Thermoanaerobaculia bacterium]